MQRTLALPLLLLAALVLAGCGVSFSESFEGTETFEDLQLTGERVPGGELTVSVSVRQGYPVPVKVGCYYENSDELTDDQRKVTFEDRALRIGETILQPAAGQEPDDDELPQQRLTFSFSVPEPGRYFVACLAPHAADDGIGLFFRVSQRGGSADAPAAR